MSTTDSNIVSLMNETRTVADYSTTWKAFEALDRGLYDLAHTVDILNDIDFEDVTSFDRIATMQRHLLSDLRALKSSYASARRAIFGPKKGGRS